MEQLSWLLDTDIDWVFFFMFDMKMCLCKCFMSKNNAKLHVRKILASDKMKIQNNSCCVALSFLNCMKNVSPD